MPQSTAVFIHLPKDFVMAVVKENADEERCGGPNGV